MLLNMVSRKYSRKGIYSKINITIKMFISTTVIIVLLLEIFIMPIIIKASEYQGNMFVTKLLSDTINNVLIDKDIQYNSIIIIERDKNDKITSIQTDIKTINSIKTKLTSIIANEFSQMPSYNYYLPLGTLIGNAFIMGRGPNIKLKLIPMGYLNSQIISEFVAVGINQTNYKVMLNITLDYTTIIPLHKSFQKLNTNFVIVDTIIVGEIPEYYTNIKSDSSNPMGYARTGYPQTLN